MKRAPKMTCLLIAAGAAGIAALSLPFTSDVSLTLLRLAGPFSLTALVSSAAVRWIMSSSFSRAEKATAYGAAAMAACSTLGILLYGLRDWQPSNLNECLEVTLPLTTLLLGGHSVSTTLRWGKAPGISALTALEAAYAANNVLATAVAYLLHIVFVSARGPTHLEERGNHETNDPCPGYINTPDRL